MMALAPHILCEIGRIFNFVRKIASTGRICKFFCIIKSVLNYSSIEKARMKITIIKINKYDPLDLSKGYIQKNR